MLLVPPQAARVLLSFLGIPEPWHTNGFYCHDAPLTITSPRDRSDRIFLPPDDTRALPTLDVLSHPLFHTATADRRCTFVLADTDELRRLECIRHQVRALELAPRCFRFYREDAFDAEALRPFYCLTRLELSGLRDAVDIDGLDCWAPQLQSLTLTRVRMRVSEKEANAVLRRLASLRELALEYVSGMKSFAIGVGLPQLQSLTLLVDPMRDALGGLESLGRVAPLETLITQGAWSDGAVTLLGSPSSSLGSRDGGCAVCEVALQPHLPTLRTLWSLDSRHAWRLPWLLANAPSLHELRVQTTVIWTNSERLLTNQTGRQLTELRLGFETLLDRHRVSSLASLTHLECLHLAVSDDASDCRALYALQKLRSLEIANATLGSLVIHLPLLTRLRCVDYGQSYRAFGAKGNVYRGEAILPVIKEVVIEGCVLLNAFAERVLARVEQVEIRDHREMWDLLQSLVRFSSVRRLAFMNCSHCYFDTLERFQSARKLEELYVSLSKNAREQKEAPVWIKFPLWIRQATKLRIIAVPAIRNPRCLPVNLERLYIPFQTPSKLSPGPELFGSLARLANLRVVTMSIEATCTDVLMYRHHMPRLESVWHPTQDCLWTERRCTKFPWEINATETTLIDAVLVPKWSCEPVELSALDWRPLLYRH